MGKKGKRSKQKATRKEAEKIFWENEKLIERATNDQKEGLSSKAAIQFMEVIQPHESKSKLMMLYSFTRDQQIQTYSQLMTLYYRRRNYIAAIECCNSFMAKFDRSCTNGRLLFSLYYQLMMLRLNRQECHLSDFVNIISQEVSDPRKKQASSIIFYDAVDTFRAHKQFDSAIQLEKTFGSLLRSPKDRKLFLALSYFEQYRVEFHERSRMRKQDFLKISHLMYSLLSEFPLESNIDHLYCLLLAEYYYLTHTLVRSERTKEENVKTALALLMGFLSGLDKVKQACCFSCGQVVTPTEVKFVCSGCQIASYCSIDHQRAIWKKEGLAGSRIGHEIFCPLYNAYRKYKHAKDLKDEAKESRMKRRLDRECKKFLEYGLGLKNKCFPCEYQK